MTIIVKILDCFKKPKLDKKNIAIHSKANFCENMMVFIKNVTLKRNKEWFS